MTPIASCVGWVGLWSICSKPCAFVYCEAVPPVVPELASDDDYSHFDDIPEPDSGEEFFPTPKVCCSLF